MSVVRGGTWSRFTNNLVLWMGVLVFDDITMQSVRLKYNEVVGIGCFGDGGDGSSTG